MIASHPAERRYLTTIDRQARAWQKKLVAQWHGHRRPSTYPFHEGLVAALFLEAGMDRPLPDDRMDLVRAATRREEPSREAFVTLALVDYVEDLDAGDSATLPYQLAWARSGRTLSERTGLPGGIAKARWLEAPE